MALIRIKCLVVLLGMLVLCPPLSAKNLIQCQKKCSASVCANFSTEQDAQACLDACQGISSAHANGVRQACTERKSQLAAIVAQHAVLKEAEEFFHLKNLLTRKGTIAATPEDTEVLFDAGQLTEEERDAELNRIAAYSRYLDHTVTVEDIALLEAGETIHHKDAQIYRRESLNLYDEEGDLSIMSRIAIHLGVKEEE